MARHQGVKARPGRSVARAPSKPAAVSPAAPAVAAPPSPPKRKTTPAQFAAEVRAEARKISWPSWKETWITSVMVFLMVALTALFFLVIDGGLAFLTTQFLKLAG